MELKWKHPFTSKLYSLFVWVVVVIVFFYLFSNEGIIAGPTSCGKSTFIQRFLKHLEDLIDTEIYEIIYCAPPSSYPDLKECKTQVRFIDGLLPSDDLIEDDKSRFIIVDDMMSEIDNRIVDFFVKKSHHTKTSICLISQNLFHQKKGQRDISLNAHYIVAYKSPRDRSQMFTLGRQVCPKNPAYVQEIFEDATQVPYGYLLLDLTQTTPDHLRYRTNIFPDDNPSNIIYVPKNYCV